jgi:hypothetical protein
VPPESRQRFPKANARESDAGELGAEPDSTIIFLKVSNSQPG